MIRSPCPENRNYASPELRLPVRVMTTSDEIRRLAFMDWIRSTGTNLFQVARKSGVPYSTLDSYKRGDTASLKGSTEVKIAQAYDLPVEVIFGHAEEIIDDIEPNHVRAWREHQGVSLKQLADGLGTTTSVVELLEQGRLTLSPKWLRRLSDVLKVRAGWILEYAPAELPRDVLDIFAQIPQDQQDHALQVLETFRRTGTAN